MAFVIYLDHASPHDSNGRPLTAPDRGKTRPELRRVASFRLWRNRDIHGLSTHKVYPPGMSPHRDVSFYLTFSPLPRPKAGRLFSVVLAVTRLFPARHLPVRKYGTLCSPDFPPQCGKTTIRATNRTVVALQK